MSTFRETFKGKHTFLVVIHAEGGTQALRNAEIAQAEGAHGVFLINHRITHMQLFECYGLVREKFPKLWIGINCLGLGLHVIRSVPEKVEGLWIDNAGVNDVDRDPTHDAREFQKLRKRSGWKGIYFGGVAFKGQPEVGDFYEVTKLAKPYVDVITTSGTRTGSAPAVDKIMQMKSAVGNQPLAIASGITPENVPEFMPYADCFMVATGISKSFTELDPSKVRAFSKALKI